jgi:SAM-dependent methyltransferase
MSVRPCHVCGETSRLERRFRSGAYTIVRCRACGLVYTNEIPSAAELEAVYGRAFFEVGQKFAGRSEGVGLVNAAARVSRLFELPDVGRARWLDVGCATGDFLEAARRAGVSEVRGVELSEYAASEARARGFDVARGDFASVALPPAAFDVVTMWDYIEHVPDPAASLHRAFAALRPGGYLAISTGDAASLAARVMGRFWHLMIPPKHLYFFTLDTLVRLLQGAGFLMVRIDKPGKRVPLDFAAWKAAVMLAPSAAPAVLRAAGRLGLGRLQPSINLRDIMTVCARRP